MEILHVSATGLVGRLVLLRLLAAPASLAGGDARATIPSANPRLVNPVVDFDALPADAAWWDVDAVV